LLHAELRAAIPRSQRCPGRTTTRPTNFVDLGDVLRFANWMHKGKPTTGTQTLSTTEDGSYFVNGATSMADLGAISREPDATWVIPTVDLPRVEACRF
jgi:hypothetical protein